MDIIPAIDIRGGRCVQLVQGDYARETVFGDDPVAMARRWAAEGALRLHIVDLDAAREGRPVNDAVITRIMREVPELSVQIAGGVRDLGAVRRWLDAGAHRVVIGTMAVEKPDAIGRAVAKHGDRIAIAVDARGGKVATDGWLETSEAPVDEFMREMARRGVRRFIYTDISRDGMLQHLDFAALRHVLEVLADTAATATLIYSGGVTSIEDVLALDEHPLEGAIIGTALYDGRISLTAALRALAAGGET